MNAGSAQGGNWQLKAQNEPQNEVAEEINTIKQAKKCTNAPENYATASSDTASNKNMQSELDWTSTAKVEYADSLDKLTFFDQDLR